MANQVNVEKAQLKLDIVIQKLKEINTNQNLPQKTFLVKDFI